MVREETFGRICLARVQFRIGEALGPGKKEGLPKGAACHQSAKD